MIRYFNDGDTVLFAGDSVTDCGRDRKDPLSLGEGYPLLFKNIYDILFPGNKVKFINRGVSGDRTRDLLRNYDKYIKDENPDFISIMIGVNDTWRDKDDDDFTSPERLNTEYETVLKNIKRDLPNAKILILEQFCFSDNLDRITKRAVTRELAKKYADYFIPVHDIMTEAVNKGFKEEELSKDGVHPKPLGFSLIASEILKTLKII